MFELSITKTIMKHVLTFAFAMLLALQTFTSFANNTDNPKGKKSESYPNVSAAIKGLLDAHDFGDLSATEGKVVIRYVVDQDRKMNIIDISGSHAALKEYVFQTLNGREVSSESIESNKENVLKLNFSLHSN
ncbi:MAG TPA: hypothetical protein VF691_20205 [Cytophagaceae bacterium]